MRRVHCGQRPRAECAQDGRRRRIAMRHVAHFIAATSSLSGRLGILGRRLSFNLMVEAHRHACGPLPLRRADPRIHNDDCRTMAGAAPQNWEGPRQQKHDKSPPSLQGRGFLDWTFLSASPSLERGHSRGDVPKLFLKPSHLVQTIEAHLDAVEALFDACNIILRRHVSDHVPLNHGRKLARRDGWLFRLHHFTLPD